MSLGVTRVMLVLLPKITELDEDLGSSFMKRNKSDRLSKRNY